MKTINAFSPIGGTLIKEYPLFGKEDILSAKLRAEETFRIYNDLEISQRIKLLKSLRKTIADESENITSLTSKITGKVKAEILNTEVLPVLMTLKYYEKHLKSFLKPKKIKVPFLFQGITAKTELRPSGIALIISPWNFPFSLSILPAIDAVASGNAVLLKPSELTLPIGELVENLFKSAGFPTFLVQSIYGNAETAKELIKIKPNRVFFTGSTNVGKQIIAQTAEHAIPVLLEMGGKSPMIIFADADFDRAVNGALFGAFCNSGQVCVAASRIYIERPIYQRFIDELAKKANSLIQGDINAGDLGFMISSSTFERLNEYIKNATSKGGKVICGNLSGKYFSPVIIANASEEMLIMQEETFGPVVPLTPFDSTEEVIRLANKSRYGLSASIWTKDIAKARRTASKLQAGNININDIIQSVGIPSLPFGGIKESGLGRYHNNEGLKFFSDEVSIVEDKATTKNSILWFPYGEHLYEQMSKVIKYLYGSNGKFLPFIINMIKLYLRRFRT